MLTFRMKWTVMRPNGLALSSTFKGNIIEAVTGLGVLKGSPPRFYSFQDEKYTVQVNGVDKNFEVRAIPSDHRLSRISSICISRSS
jgi:hypothetical protein